MKCSIKISFIIILFFGFGVMAALFYEGKLIDKKLVELTDKDKIKLKDSVTTFNQSKYYDEWKCWSYRRDTSDQNLNDIFITKMNNRVNNIQDSTLKSEYTLNSNEFNESDRNMKLLLKLYRKDQSPCK